VLCDSFKIFIRLVKAFSLNKIERIVLGVQDMKKVLFSLVIFVVASSVCLSAGTPDEGLWEAVNSQDVSGVRGALEEDANPNYMQNDETVLMVACRLGNMQIVQLLLGKRGINASFKNGHGQTALMIAAEKCNNLSIFRLLVDKGHANVNDKDHADETVLMHAMKTSDVNVLKFLWDQHITNFNATDSRGNTAAMHAAALNKPESIKFLAHYAMGFDWTTTNMNGDNVLSLAIAKGGLDMVVVLLREVPDFDIDMKMGNGNPTLFWAIEKGVSSNIIEYLMDFYDAQTLLETTDRNGRGIKKFIESKINIPNKKKLLRKIQEAEQAVAKYKAVEN